MRPRVRYLLILLVLAVLAACEQQPGSSQSGRQTSRSYDLSEFGNKTPASKNQPATSQNSGKRSVARGFDFDAFDKKTSSGKNRPSSRSAAKCVISELKQPRPIRKDWQNRDTKTDYYALAISWSPQFCANPRNRSRARFQCVANRFHFVVHGLWPQSHSAPDKFGHPRHCKDNSELLSAGLIRKHVCTVPGAQLMQGEWVKHGSCAFDSPEKYFGQIEKLWSTLKKPDMSKAATTGSLSVEQLLQAFVKANPGKLRKEHMKVWLNRRGYLREVVVCYDKSYNYTDCNLKGAPDTQMVRVQF